eukprot:TRINITY_DN13791_c0_g1_i1.p1 TRINITY_DN13791_c0_g1~~TRINITY_DN13791_c0_g1_i1.p1  ORF type:complete len:130 (-),score=11.05 TRINITY_DN13791_c0_g1_i1:108-497(-)
MKAQANVLARIRECLQVRVHTPSHTPFPNMPPMYTTACQPPGSPGAHQRWCRSPPANHRAPLRRLAERPFIENSIYIGLDDIEHWDDEGSDRAQGFAMQRRFCADLRPGVYNFCLSAELALKGRQPKRA